jgi:FecR protein
MKYDDLLADLRERTRPAPEAVGRVRQRLDLQLRSAKTELGTLPRPTPEAVARVSARLREARGASRPRWVAPALGLGLGALAFAAVTVGGWVALQEPAHEQRSLAGIGAGVTVARGLAIDHDGQGSLRRDGRTVSIDWDYGRLALEVDPDRGLTVEVLTPEGRVQLVGTAVVVERNALGTRVEVRDGEVQVACSGGPATALAADHDLTCYPVTAAGWLNRTRALEEQGLNPVELIGEVDRGLQAPGTPAELGELWTVRTNALVSAGRTSEALESAEQALTAIPDPARAESLHRTAARLALILGDCSRALPHLDALASLESDEVAYRDRCRSR